jgi:hypothetical protein
VEEPKLGGGTDSFPEQFKLSAPKNYDATETLISTYFKSDSGGLINKLERVQFWMEEICKQNSYDEES